MTWLWYHTEHEFKIEARLFLQLPDVFRIKIDTDHSILQNFPNLISTADQLYRHTEWSHSIYTSNYTALHLQHIEAKTTV